MLCVGELDFGGLPSQRRLAENLRESPDFGSGNCVTPGDLSSFSTWSGD